MPLSSGTRLGPYEIIGPLGAGGMGEVYRASHGMMRRPSAVKLLRVDRTGETNLRRFEREVQLTARLTHPNTITIFDYGRTPDGVFYYAMELLEGATLQRIVTVAGAQRALEAGARFIVMPVTDPGLVAWCAGRGVPAFPGALTPTEILAAWDAGASAVKLFPAASVGPDYLRQLAGPLPQTLLPPSSRVTNPAPPSTGLNGVG